MNRRGAISGLFTEASFYAIAQSAKRTLERIEFIIFSSSERRCLLQYLRLGLKDYDHTEGDNIVIKALFAEGNLSQLPGMFAEMVEWRPDVIVVSGTPTAGAAQKFGLEIPVVFAVSDLTLLDLSGDLRHPGGWFTGVSFQNVELTAKRLDLLNNFVPNLRISAFLYRSQDNSNIASAHHPANSAKTFGFAFALYPFVTELEAQKAIASACDAWRTAGMLAAGLTVKYYRSLAELALQYRFPALAAERSFPKLGGLGSYATNFGDQIRRATSYVDRILKGALPGSLPIEQPTNFEFVINTGTARRLGVDVLTRILATADEVIE